jgi:tRNA nucleotidyltransferase (CCA-adding enzyme)
MKASEKAEKLFAEVSVGITPTAKESAAEKAFAMELVEKLEDALRLPSARVYFIGSTARDTGLHLEKDIDLFIAFPQKYSREEIAEKTFAATRAGIPAKWETHYAEHPYLAGVVGNYKVEVIPCFQIVPHEPIKSAVDRSPLHMDYLQKRLNFRQKRDVRLLKAILKRAGVYGAEATIGGFSGLLCEYLVLNYRSLWGLLTAAAQWRPPVVIDIESAWRGKEAELAKKFEGSPLVMVDAIDRNRNAAAAVSNESLAILSAISQAFAASPSREFFTASEQKPPLPSAIATAITSRGTAFFAVELPRPRGSVEDTVFPQARKLMQSLCDVLAREEFPIMDCHLMMDERRFWLLVELPSASRPAVKVFQGPPAWFSKDSIDFAAGHKRAVRGPYLKGERWYAEEKRTPVLAKELLQLLLKTGKGLAVGGHLEAAFKRARLVEGAKIPSEMDAAELKKLDAFVRKKAAWL